MGDGAGRACGGYHLQVAMRSTYIRSIHRPLSTLLSLPSPPEPPRNAATPVAFAVSVAAVGDIGVAPRAAEVDAAQGRERS
jgi:hypothetical protein